MPVPTTIGGITIWSWQTGSGSCLICDPETDKSAASLAVNTRSLRRSCRSPGHGPFPRAYAVSRYPHLPQTRRIPAIHEPSRGQQQRLDRYRVHQLLLRHRQRLLRGGARPVLPVLHLPHLCTGWVDKERNAVDSSTASSCRTTCAAATRCIGETVNPHPSPNSRWATSTPWRISPAGICARTSLRSTNPLQCGSHGAGHAFAGTHRDPAGLVRSLLWCHSGSPPRPPGLSHPLYRLDDLGIRIHDPGQGDPQAGPDLPCRAWMSITTKPLTFLSHLIGYEGKAACSPAQGAGLGQSARRRRHASAAPTSGLWRELRPPPWLEHVDDIIAALFGYLKLIERGRECRPGARGEAQRAGIRLPASGAGPGPRYRLRPRAQPVQATGRTICSTATTDAPSSMSP